MSKSKQKEEGACKPLAFFGGLTLFTDLDPKDLALFTQAAKIKSYKKGSMLYLEGDHAQFFMLFAVAG
jgi:CRP-like cAMP-binding protein